MNAHVASLGAYPLALSIKLSVQVNKVLKCRNNSHINPLGSRHIIALIIRVRPHATLLGQSFSTAFRKMCLNKGCSYCFSKQTPLLRLMHHGNKPQKLTVMIVIWCYSCIKLRMGSSVSMPRGTLIIADSGSSSRVNSLGYLLIWDNTKCSYPQAATRLTM
jgi:hypothetical protein